MLTHEALLYGSDDEYLGAAVPFVHDGLAAGATVAAVVPPWNLDVLRTELGRIARQVHFIDAVGWYRQPAAVVAQYDSFLSALGKRPAWVLGEVQFGEHRADWAAWTQYEAALNRALAHHDARVVCPYDVRRLAPSVVADARRTHPYLLEGRQRRTSAEYVEPERLLPDLPRAIDVPVSPADLELRVDDSALDVRHVRRAFAGVAASRLPEPRVEELVLAVNEILTNAVLHGGGRAVLRVWTSHGQVVCVVDDDGDGVDDPLLGLRPVQPGATGGYGLWLARQLFDRAELRSSPTGGLRVVLAAAL